LNKLFLDILTFVDAAKVKIKHSFKVQKIN